VLLGFYSTFFLLYIRYKRKQEREKSALFLWYMDFLEYYHCPSPDSSGNPFMGPFFGPIKD
jgi:hypothetical protein